MNPIITDTLTDFPEKIGFLVNPLNPDYLCRNKIIYGGRGGLKSWGTVDAALIRGAQQFERVLCCRETMDSIKESLHYLISQRIYDLGLQKCYKVLETSIRGPIFEGWGQTEFIFAGLRHNVRNIKSLEGTTICLVEEADQVSKESWDTLIPTVRWEKEGRSSEIWVVFNPKFKKDDTYQRWLIDTPPNSVVCKTSWRDNPWFPKVLRDEMEHKKATDYEGYLHVWEGECVQALEGAIFAHEYRIADQEGRIMALPYDPGRPVDTFWDLGFGDRNCIWMGQRCGPWMHFIDYLESCAHPLSWYIQELQKRPYAWGTDWLPHDGVDALLHGNLTQDRSKSPDQVLRALGRKVRIAPKLAITSRIQAGRMAFPTCRFDSRKCAEGIAGLQQYQWGPDAASGQERTKPRHDWASHPADGWMVYAVSRKEEPEGIPVKPPPRRIISAWT